MLLTDRRPPKCRVSYKTPKKSPKSSADKMQGACMLKDQTLKKTRTFLFPDQEIGPWYGGVAQRMGGGKHTRQCTLQKKNRTPPKRASGVLSLGFLYRKNRATTPEGGGERTRRSGVQNPLLGEVSFVRFSSPLFFPPPWRPLRQGVYRREVLQKCAPFLAVAL